MLLQRVVKGKEQKKHPGNYFGIKLHNKRQEKVRDEEKRLQDNVSSYSSRYQISFLNKFNYSEWVFLFEKRGRKNKEIEFLSLRWKNSDEEVFLRRSTQSSKFFFRKKNFKTFQKEIIKNEEKFMNQKNEAHMSQFHSRIGRISSCVTKTFGMVRKCASIYG